MHNGELLYIICNATYYILHIRDLYTAYTVSINNVSQIRCIV